MGFVTTAELGDRVGQDLTSDDRAAAVLADAEAAVKAYTGQDFEVGTSTVVVPVKRGRIRLAQLPVRAVASVQTLSGSDLTYTFDGIRTVAVGSDSIPRFDYEPFTSVPSTVRVEYEHGFDVIPADVVAVVCQVAGRAFGVNAMDSGISQETLGSYNYSTGSAASSGALGLLLPERAVLDRYRGAGQSFEAGR